MTRLDIVTERPEAHVEIVGDGPPLTFLHGWRASGELMLPLARMVDQHHRCIAPDFPGFGKTGEPDAVWGTHDYAEWVLRLLDRLGIERTDLFAHSFGGKVTLQLATIAPERVGKIVLTGSAGIRPPRSLRSQARIHLFKAVRRVIPYLPGPASRAAGRWRDRQGSPDYRAASGMMRSTFVRIVNEDLRELLPHITRPTLLLWGDRDDETPLSDGRLMESLIPDSGIVVLSGGSHYAYLEQAARVATVVETFLAGPPP